MIINCQFWPNFECWSVMVGSVDFSHSKLNVTKLHDVGFCRIWAKIDIFEFQQFTRGFSCVLRWRKHSNLGSFGRCHNGDLVPSCFTILNWSFLTKSSKLTILRFSSILIKIEHFEQNSQSWWVWGSGYLNWIIDKSWRVEVILRFSSKSWKLANFGRIGGSGCSSCQGDI